MGGEEMSIRTPTNLTLDNICPNCRRRIFFKGDQNHSKRRYSAPRWFRQMFKLTAGTYPLGVYRVVKCEVCNKKMAVFDNNRGILANQVVVLYSCSLLGVSLEPVLDPMILDNKEGITVSCDDQNSCYACPLKAGDDHVGKR
jgi:DNA-directed RNA polymerase subunit RPC12/RpoP